MYGALEAPSMNGPSLLEAGAGEVMYIASKHHTMIIVETGELVHHASFQKQRYSE